MLGESYPTSNARLFSKASMSLAPPAPRGRHVCLAVSLTTTRKLESSAPSHPFAQDLKEKASAFDEAAAKFAIAA